jgi:hypothetical protein
MEAAAGTGQDVSSAFEQFDAQVSQAIAGEAL